MTESIHMRQENLGGVWSKLPKWMVYLSNLPSVLLWFAIMMKLSSPIFAFIMILTLGVPTKLLHHIYRCISILRHSGPTIFGHVIFFSGQCIIYFSLGVYAFPRLTMHGLLRGAGSPQASLVPAHVTCVTQFNTKGIR